MRISDVSHAIQSFVDTPTRLDEEVIAHYEERGYERISYHGRPVFLFTHERDFGDRRHAVTLHGTDAPAVPEHIYQYVIVKYCYAGAWPVTVDGEPLVMRAGDCLITDRNVPQQIPRTPKDMLGVNLILNEEFFAEQLMGEPGRSSRFAYELTTKGASHDQYRLLRTADDERARTLVDLILCEVVEPSPLANHLTDCLIEAFLSHVLGTHCASREGAQESSRSELVGSMREYIARNYKDGNMNRMAVALGYQRSYLSRVIKEATGSTFKQLINAERMKRATVLLDAGEMPVYEVAEQAGIPNLTSFYKRFREWSGMTPQEWRERAR